MYITILQLVYVFLGVAINLMSIRNYKKSGVFYTPTNPKHGVIAMLLYASVLPLGVLEWQLPFQISMIFFIILISAGGILKHLITKRVADHSSQRARGVAIFVNIFGVVLSVYAIK